MTNKERARQICRCNICTARECCNKTLSDCCDEFKHIMKMAKWKEKQMIEKAADFTYKVLVGCGWLTSYQCNNFIEELKKAMEE